MLRHCYLGNWWSKWLLKCFTDGPVKLKPTPFTRYNRLLNRPGLTTGLTIVLTEQLFVQLVVKPRLSNQFDKHSLTTVFSEQTVCSTRLSNQLYNPVWQPCWTNSHCSFNRGVQPVWQPAVYKIQPFCQTVCSTQFDNRLNVCIHDTTGCQTGFTTGCIVCTNI